MAKKKSDKKFIQGMHLKKGALRAELGVKGSGPIPASKLEKSYSQQESDRTQAGNSR